MLYALNHTSETVLIQSDLPCGFDAQCGEPLMWLVVQDMNVPYQGNDVIGDGARFFSHPLGNCEVPKCQF